MRGIYSLRAPETTDDTRTLLERLRKRRDLLATIAEEIDELLGSTRKASSVPPRAFEPETSPSERSPREEMASTLTESKPKERQKPQGSATPPAQTSTDYKPTRRERVRGALFGAILGTAAGIIAMSGLHPFGLLTGAGGAIAGALIGTHRRGIVAVLLGAASGWFLVAIFWTSTRQFAAGGVFGAPPGAILGAIAGLILRKIKKWT